MRIPIAVVLGAWLLAFASAAQAQQQTGTAGTPATPRPAGTQGRDQAAQPADDPLPTPAELGISLSRVRKDLREVPPTRSTLLRYDFRVDVYGTKPKVDFFKDFDLSPNGAVRYGGMTHAEFMNVVTPQAFRAPSGDLLSVAMLAIQQLMKRGDNKAPDR